MAGKMKLVRAATGVAAAMGILTLGIFPGFPLEQGRSQGTKAYRQLDTSRIVVDVQRSFSLADYPLVLKVTAPDSGEFADFGQSEYAVPDGKTESPATSEFQEKSDRLAMVSPDRPASLVAPSPSGPFSEDAAASQKPPRTTPVPASAGASDTGPTDASSSAGADIRVSAAHQEGATILRVATVGPAPFSTFTLPDPPRFVVDVKGAFIHRGEGLFVLDAPGVSRVRAGKHPESFRIVFDLTAADAPLPRVLATDSGLEIIFPGQIAGKKQ